jgi:peroxiredoxin
VAFALVGQQGRILLRVERLEQAGARPPEDLPRVPLLPPGELLPTFQCRDLRGLDRTLEDFRGKFVLLVNWDPECSFCRELAPDLDQLAPTLRRSQTKLIFAIAAEAGSPAPLLSHPKIDAVLLRRAEEPDFFSGFGTPSAYLLDSDGRVTEPLAVGARAVVELALRATARERRPLASERALTESRITRDGLKPGSDAPSFTLPAVDGTKLSLKEFHGHRTLLVFSDANCGPCTELNRDLAKLYDRRAQRHIRLLMIGRGNILDYASKVSADGLTFPIAVQPGWQVSKRYGIFATPSAFLIDRNGVIERKAVIGKDDVLSLMAAAIDVGS